MFPASLTLFCFSQFIPWWPQFISQHTNTIVCKLLLHTQSFVKTLTQYSKSLLVIRQFVVDWRGLIPKDNSVVHRRSCTQYIHDAHLCLVYFNPSQFSRCVCKHKANAQIPKNTTITEEWDSIRQSHSSFSDLTLGERSPKRRRCSLKTRDLYIYKISLRIIRHMHEPIWSARAPYLKGVH